MSFLSSEAVRPTGLDRRDNTHTANFGGGFANSSFPAHSQPVPGPVLPIYSGLALTQGTQMPPVMRALSLKALLQAENRYIQDVAALWYSYALFADRLAMQHDIDLYFTVASIDLLQQIVWELVSVAYVGELMWDDNSGDDDLSREEFVARVRVLTETMVVPGRDLRLSEAAGRVWDLSSVCRCAACYRCPSCACNECKCGAGCTHIDLWDECCSGSAVLRATSLYEWHGKTEYSWPSPKLDLVRVMAAVVVCEAVNANAGSGFLWSDSKVYNMRMHVSMKRFWKDAPDIIAGLPNQTPVLLRMYNNSLPHVCRGQSCERAEYAADSALRDGRCDLCAEGQFLCEDTCKNCRFLSTRCAKCMQRRMQKPRGCPSSGEAQGYQGAGCCGIACRCAPHVECQCMKCLLAKEVCLLMAVPRGIHVMAIDRLDMPSHSVGHSTGVPLVADPVAHALDEEEDKAIKQMLLEGSAVRKLVAWAVAGAVVCQTHANSVSTDEAPECPGCLTLEQREESMMIMVDGKLMVMHSQASLLCELCTKKVYSVSKAIKIQQTKCRKCTTASEVLVRRLSTQRVADLVADLVREEKGEASMASEDREAVHCGDEGAAVNKSCMEEYLNFNLLAGGIRVPETGDAGEETVQAFKRADTSVGCRPAPGGLTVPGQYDWPEPRGLDQMTGDIMQGGNVHDYVMGHEGVVLSTVMAREANLEKRFVEAASNAFNASFPFFKTGMISSPSDKAPRRHKRPV